MTRPRGARRRCFGRASRRAFVFALAMASCRDNGLADGSACVGPAQCSSGLCLDRAGDLSVCAHRCMGRSDCPDREVCGRFDFRSRDDGGLPVGPEGDVVRVCRAALNGRCDRGCAAGLRCLGGTDGTCVSPCATDADCGGRHCVAVGCVRVCSPPCDDLAECPRGYSCDLAAMDHSGHGECIPIDPAATRDAGVGDVTCGGDA